MRIKLLIITQFFPSQARPLFALYNKEDFESLSKHLDIELAVPVSWITWLTKRKSCQQTTSTLEPHYFPYFYTPKVLRRFYGFFLWLSLRLRQGRIFSRRPDVVLVTWAYPDAVSVARLLQSKGVPFLVKVLGSDVNLHCQYPPRRKQVVVALNQAKAVLSVSGAMKDVLSEHGVSRQKIHVLYNGVDRGKFRPEDQADARRRLQLAQCATIFMFVGNLKAAKGAVDIVNAFERMTRLQEVEDPVLILVGEGEDRHLVERAANRARRECENVDIRLVGSKAHAELNDWMNAADFVCLPSYAEGVPNTLLEAMTCAKPVIATRVGGIPEIVSDDTGLLVEAGDIEALAEAMLEATKTQWNAQEIHDHVRDFTWENNADEFLRIVREKCLN